MTLNNYRNDFKLCRKKIFPKKHKRISIKRMCLTLNTANNENATFRYTPHYIHIVLKI